MRGFKGPIFPPLLFIRNKHKKPRERYVTVILCIWIKDQTVSDAGAPHGSPWPCAHVSNEFCVSMTARENFQPNKALSSDVLCRKNNLRRPCRDRYVRSRNNPQNWPGLAWLFSFFLGTFLFISFLVSSRPEGRFHNRYYDLLTYGSSLDLLTPPRARPRVRVKPSFPPPPLSPRFRVRVCML